VDLPAYREEVRRCVECAVAEGPMTAVDDRPRQKTRIDAIFDIERRASLSSAQGGTRRETFSGRS
jgi:hypothetical protein